MVNGKKIGIGVGIVIIITVIASLLISTVEFQEPSSDLPSSDLAILEERQEFFDNVKIPYRSDPPSLFETYAYGRDAFYVDDVFHSSTWNFELKDELMEQYEEIALWNDPQNTVVIKPVFTFSAYADHGFYSYYTGNCDASCLTTKIISNTTQGFAGSQPAEKKQSLLIYATQGYSGSLNAVKVLNLLGYSFVTDIEVDKNPKILQEYDKVILLHNEYVTKNEFEAIVNHSNVVYLYPNALYAEIKTNYEDNTITLVRGHSYPDQEIRNGFDWKFDNSELEYDLLCKDWNFNKIDNGVMLNCYPENVIFINFELLKAIKEL